MKTLIDHISFAVLLVDEKNFLVDRLNAAAFQWFGDVEGVFFFSLFPKLNEEFCKNRISRGKTFNYEYGLQETDSVRMRFLSITVRKFHHEEYPHHLIVECSDISKVREQEKLLENYTDVIQKQANEIELAKLQASLEAARVKSIQSAKLALLGEMAGGIAHEINNPLAIIKGKTEMVMRLVRKSPVDLDKIEAGLGVVIRTSDRIAKIVRGLKSFSRHADNDPMQLEKASVIMEETLELCRERFNNHGVELAYEAKADGFISCRPAQISQIVMNLLSNAFDAVQDLENKWVKLELDASASDVTISLTDSGDGIKPEIINNLMQPFFTTKEVGKGTGLGLSIARAIAEEHDSEFYYDPTSPNTRFVLRLPRASAPAGDGCNN